MSQPPPDLPLAGPGEEPLAELVAKGDREAFERFYELYLPRVYAFAARRLGSAREAEALAEAILEETTRRLERLPPGVPLVHFVLAVSRRVAESRGVLPRGASPSVAQDGGEL